ncbi:MAG: aminodeoxychorismate lyase [Lysobacter sp.]|nr:aminodeoxychorismate lyase [Lysobacter sp.]
MTTRFFIGTAQVDSLPANNRGLAYGDGLFETMRMHRGDVAWWDAHWSRLMHGAARLRLRLPDASFVRDQASQLFANEEGVLKLVVTRAGGRGYAPSPDSEPNWLLSLHPLPSKPREGGLALRWCDLRLAIQPALAGIKHCNRLEQVLARAEWQQDTIDDGLMRDHEGFVVCATSANLFVLREGGWTTPLVDRCGVAGVCRAWCMAELATTEARLNPEQVESSDAIFLCNAVRGILPVERLDGREWSPHSQVAALQARLAQVHPAFASHREVS